MWGLQIKVEMSWGSRQVSFWKVCPSRKQDIGIESHGPHPASHPVVFPHNNFRSTLIQTLDVQEMQDFEMSSAPMLTLLCNRNKYLDCFVHKVTMDEFDTQTQNLRIPPTASRKIIVAMKKVLFIENVQ